MRIQSTCAIFDHIIIECPRKVLESSTHAAIVRFYTYIIRTHILIVDLKAPTGISWSSRWAFETAGTCFLLRCMTSVCVSRSTWSSTQFCATQHEETHFAVVVINGWLTDFHIQSVPELLSLRLTADSLITFEYVSLRRISKHDNFQVAYIKEFLAKQDMKTTVNF